MNADNNWEETVLLFVAVAGAFILGFIFGGLRELGESRAEATKAGAGEYYLDKDNEKQFRYIAPKKTN